MTSSSSQSHNDEVLSYTNYAEYCYQYSWRLCRLNIIVDNAVTIYANTLEPAQNGRRFAGDIFKSIFVKEYIYWQEVCFGSGIGLVQY